MLVEKSKLALYLFEYFWPHFINFFSYVTTYLSLKFQRILQGIKYVDIAATFTAVFFTTCKSCRDISVNDVPILFTLLFNLVYTIKHWSEILFTIIIDALIVYGYRGSKYFTVRIIVIFNQDITTRRLLLIAKGQISEQIFDWLNFSLLNNCWVFVTIQIDRSLFGDARWKLSITLLILNGCFLFLLYRAGINS